MIEHGDERRERILRTSARLFGKEGYYGTRMSEVARQARISPKTLYKYFSSKKELFIETRNLAMSNLIEGIFSAMTDQPPDQDSFTVIRNAFRTYSDYIRRNRGSARILAEGVAIIDDDIQSEQRESFAVAVGAVSVLMENDVRDGRLDLVTAPDKTSLLFLSFAAILAYAVMLDLDKKSGGGFDAGYALDLFFDVMRAPA
ncbi:MAG: TetR/AcrR family transcriptional regulator [Candidatus Geothermincolia bacterium]